MNNKVDVMSNGAEALKGYFEPIKDKTVKASTNLREWTRKNPMVAACIALGAGFIVGTLFKKRKYVKV